MSDPAPLTSVAPPPRRSCVALVPSGAVVSPRFEAAVAELVRYGVSVRRVRQADPPPGVRDRMAADALAVGFDEVLLLDPAVLFDPGDVQRLRNHDRPLVCAVAPWPGRRGVACAFAPGTLSVAFGWGGGPRAVESCGLGFALVRREVFEAVARLGPPGGPPAYFAAAAAAGADQIEVRAAEDVAFCRRARAAGYAVVADTSVRVWRVGPAVLGWEDAGGDRDRHPDFTLHLVPPAAPATAVPAAAEAEVPPRDPLRPPAVPLAAGFPRVGLYVVTYPANAASLAATLASVRASDWGADPAVVCQPADWPVGRESGSRTYGRALAAAAAAGVDYAVVLEDDVRVGRHLRHNLLANPLVVRDQCDYLGLFLPDLVADPWDRAEPHLGYRLARPRYTGANACWVRNRVWGTQGLVLSRRLLGALVVRWDRLPDGQDTRVMAVCAENGVPLWYTQPCLVEHAPVASAFGTPDAFAPDFDPDFRLDPGPGFQPPEAVPGWLTEAEGELLWRAAAGKDVLELGTACGRSTACLAQAARRVVSVDAADQSEAAEWVRRFGAADRVTFLRGDVADVCGRLGEESFDLVFVDTGHDAASVERDVAAAVRALRPGGKLAFHDYPDPLWPDVRRVVDTHARRLGWRRVAQAGFVGVFRTPEVTRGGEPRSPQAT